MALAPGTCLGPYVNTAPIGVDDMREVYLSQPYAGLRGGWLATRSH